MCECALVCLSVYVCAYYKSVCVCLLACLSINGCIICKYLLVFVLRERERD